MPYLKVLFQNQSIQFLLRTRRPWVDALPKGSVSKSINTVPALGQGDPGLINALPKGSVSKSINTVPAQDKETLG